MRLPSYIYVIYPFDDKGNIAGAYVGMSACVQQRMIQHCESKDKNQQELHDLMNENGFTFQILDVVKTMDDTHLEADWIAFFDDLNIRTFNIMKKKGYVTNTGHISMGGNIQNLIRNPENMRFRVVCPTWKGNGVLWQLKELNTDSKVARH